MLAPRPCDVPQLGCALAHQLILSRNAIALLLTVYVIALIGMAYASARRLLASATVVLVISVGALVFGGPFIGIAPSSTHHNMYSMTDDSSNIINGSSVSSDMTPDKTIASGVHRAAHTLALETIKDLYGSNEASFSSEGDASFSPSDDTVSDLTMDTARVFGFYEILGFGARYTFVAAKQVSPAQAPPSPQ